jgi:hypothetical protein
VLNGNIFGTQIFSGPVRFHCCSMYNSNNHSNNIIVFRFHRLGLLARVNSDLFLKL